MTPDTASPAPEAAASEGDGHYLKAVAQVGDTRKLAVAQPIYSTSGIKLLDAGATLTSRTLERLVGHRLATPLENNLAAEGALRPADIVKHARELVSAQALLTQFAAGTDVDRLWASLAHAPLPPGVLFRLTVAREKFAKLYDHSLRAAFVALFLGLAARLGDRELELLATAALMHDFGMLHVDPACFEGDRPLDAAARRQLRAHPLTGMLIAQREPTLNPAIAIAIVQHHERLDGSGYPSAPAAEQITRLARILMLVEVVLAMVETRPHLPELQLSLILRANHRGFDRELVGFLLAALPRVQVETDPAAGHDNAVARLGQLLVDWEQEKARTTGGLAQEVRAFLGERVTRLRRFLADAGIDPQDGAAAVTDDPAAAAEVTGMMSEALWHLRQLASETSIRWPQLAADAANAGIDQTLFDWLRAASDPFAPAPAQAAAVAA